MLIRILFIMLQRMLISNIIPFLFVQHVMMRSDELVLFRAQFGNRVMTVFYQFR